MNQKGLRELSDRELFTLPGIWGLTIITACLMFFLGHNAILAGTIVFLGLVSSCLYLIIVQYRWKKRVSYREYQESRMGK